MNSEELKKEFSLLMPSEINGFKRPTSKGVDAESGAIFKWTVEF